ncbi:hypothetical protein AB0896_17240 [Streptomyces parvulus]|uniref:hypothetical protein n=1 Tax=Streptomyces parvulus TaxID=146923 RepID=UPI003455B630
MPTAAAHVVTASAVPSAISAAAAGAARRMLPARWRAEPGSGDRTPKAIGVKRAYSATTGRSMRYAAG